MISLIEALNFRCLRYVLQPLGPFHVLVGPNASGKTTFLDAVAFLGDLVSKGLEYAIAERTQDQRDLVWGRKDGSFELALEAKLPEERRALMAAEMQHFTTIRYEVKIAADARTREVGIAEEHGYLVPDALIETAQRGLFPAASAAPRTIIGNRKRGKSKKLFTKGTNDNFYSEVYPTEGRWAPSFKLGPKKSTLGNLPDDESIYPASTWLKQFLAGSIERIALNSLLIRKASPPGQGQGFKADGSNLPWVVAALEKRNPEKLREWVAHIQTALPDLENIRTVERADDRHRYLVLVYRGGLEAPSWMASDGTLRLLALTLPAYLEDFRGVYLIEEPENGIHPRAVEAMHQSLSSVYDAQILLATHSPVILSVVKPQEVLCFAKTEEGAADIVAGDRHPKLRDWRGEENLGVLFAGGVLG